MLTLSAFENMDEVPASRVVGAALYYVFVAPLLLLNGRVVRDATRRVNVAVMRAPRSLAAGCLVGAICSAVLRAAVVLGAPPGFVCVAYFSVIAYTAPLVFVGVVCPARVRRVVCSVAGDHTINSNGFSALAGFFAGTVFSAALVLTPPPTAIATPLEDWCSVPVVGLRLFLFVFVVCGVGGGCAVRLGAPRVAGRGYEMVRPLMSSSSDGDSPALSSSSHPL